MPMLGPTRKAKGRWCRSSLISTVSRALYYLYLILRYLVPGNRSYTNVRRAKSRTIFLARVGFPLRTWYGTTDTQYQWLCSRS